jgi:hypothetical protein
MLITPSPTLYRFRRASFSWTASTGLTDNSSSYSFNNTNIGDIAGHSTRTIFVITGGSGGNAADVSVTVGGNSATKLIDTGAPSVDTVSIHRIRLDTSATQATIGVEFSNSKSRCSIDVLAAYDLFQPEVLLGAVAFDAFTSGQTVAANLPVAENGCIIAGCMTSGTGGPSSGHAWTGATAASDRVVEGSARVSAARFINSAGSPESSHAFSCAASGNPGSSGGRLVAVSFR